MSKEIFLYSEDKKYKCGIELAESTDRFGYSDHSMIVLFEEREDGTHIIAEARDMLLETQKDKQIAQLKAENEILKKYETIYYLNQIQASNEDINKFKQNELHQCINISDLLKDNTKQVCEKIRKSVEALENNIFSKYNEGAVISEYNSIKLRCYDQIFEILDQIENENV